MDKCKYCGIELPLDEIGNGYNVCDGCAIRRSVGSFWRWGRFQPLARRVIEEDDRNWPERE